MEYSFCISPNLSQKRVITLSKIVSEYDQEIAQSKTAQANLWYREEEPHNNNETPGRQTK